MCVCVVIKRAYFITSLIRFTPWTTTADPVVVLYAVHIYYTKVTTYFTEQPIQHFNDAVYKIIVLYSQEATVHLKL